MIDRRTLLAFAASLAGAAGLNLPVDAQAEVVEAGDSWFTHSLFATTRIPGATWVDIYPDFKISFDGEAMERIKREQGIDVAAEIIAAAFAENVAETDQRFLKELRLNDASEVFDMNRLPAAPAREMHAHLIDMILDHSRDANTAIVSPTALTIMQSGDGDNRLVRAERDTKYGPWLCGYLNGRVRVLCDPYAAENIPVLIGTIPLEPNQRKAAIVRTESFKAQWGTQPGHLDDWKTIDVETSSLTFI